MNAATSGHHRIDCEEQDAVRSHTRAVEGASRRTPSFVERTGCIDPTPSENSGDAPRVVAGHAVQGEASISEADYIGTQAESLWRLCHASSR
jgi:hypothetical protein